MTRRGGWKAIEARIKSAEFQTAFRVFLDRVRGPDSDSGVSYEESGLVERMARDDLAFTLLPHGFFEKELFSGISWPLPFTCGDITEAATKSIYGIPTTSLWFPEAFERFIYFLDRQLYDDNIRSCDARDLPFTPLGKHDVNLGSFHLSADVLKSIAEGDRKGLCDVIRSLPGTRESRPSVDGSHSETSTDIGYEYPWETPVWRMHDCASLSIVPWQLVPHFFAEGGEHCNLKAAIVGDFSSDARDTKFSEFDVRIASIVKNVELSATIDIQRKRYVIEFVQSPNTNDSTNSVINECDLLYLYSPDSLHMIRSCLDIFYFQEYEHAADVRERLVNALSLLIAADNIEHDGIALSLCCSAMEAMISERDPTSDVSSFGAVILMPRNGERKKVVKLLRKLYDDRCEVMHGRGVSGNAARRGAARRIAAGILRGVLSYLRNCTRMGEYVDRQKFITELIVCHRNNQDLVGVPDMSSLAYIDKD